MREAEVYVPFEICEPLGIVAPPDVSDGSCPVRDVSVVTQGCPGCIQAVTFDEPVDGLADAPGVRWAERIDRGDGAPRYLLKVVPPAVPDGVPSDAEGAVTLRSVAVEDGGATQTFVGDQEALGRTVEFLRSLHAHVSLRRLSDYDGPGDDLDALTARQREVLETAYELGYYEVPRGTTADEIARELDLDRSTVTEHLQRAERNLLSSVLSG